MDKLLRKKYTVRKNKLGAEQKTRTKTKNRSLSTLLRGMIFDKKQHEWK